MFTKPLAIVDVETTGMSGLYDRVIEIGIIRVEHNEIVDTFNSLVNPQTYVSPFIEEFTGIHKNDLESAPVFEELSENVTRLLGDAIFVAHNARFDYSFIKHELKRLGYSFSAKTLCTVQLSRRLFPTLKHHSLSSLIEHFNLSFKKRHRAYDDAFAVWQFLEKTQCLIDAKTLSRTAQELIRTSYGGNEFVRRQIEELPESHGVYIFYDKDELPLYVGKSKNIKERVITHFSSDYQTAGHLSLTAKIDRIDHIKTAGELGALLLESRMIKDLKPIFNKKLREKKRLIAVRKYMRLDGYLGLKVEELETLSLDDLGTILGVFRTKQSAKEIIGQIVKKNGLCGKLSGCETTKGSCFEYKLGRCKGACIGKESRARYNARFTITFIENKQFRPWPFDGAIEIYEKNEEDELLETFKIDNWCLVDNRYGFDLDTYKIISGFIRYKSPHIRTLNHEVV